MILTHTRLRTLPLALSPLLHLSPVSQLDSIIFEYTVAELEKKIAAYGDDFEEAVEAFEQLNKALNAFCMCSDLGKEESKFCKWYDMTDMKYEAAISKTGSAKPVSLPFLPS